MLSQSLFDYLVENLTSAVRTGVYSWDSWNSYAQVEETFEKGFAGEWPGDKEYEKTQIYINAILMTQGFIIEELKKGFYREAEMSNS